MGEMGLKGGFKHYRLDFDRQTWEFNYMEIWHDLTTWSWGTSTSFEDKNNLAGFKLLQKTYLIMKIDILW